LSATKKAGMDYEFFFLSNLLPDALQQLLCRERSGALMQLDRSVQRLEHGRDRMSLTKMIRRVLLLMAPSKRVSDIISGKYWMMEFNMTRRMFRARSL